MIEERIIPQVLAEQRDEIKGFCAIHPEWAQESKVVKDSLITA